jgi:hypothetical protein
LSIDADCIGEGGGSGSLRADLSFALSEEIGEGMESSRLPLDSAERILLPDTADAASDLSAFESPLADIEFLGDSVLSDFELLPGIFDRSDLNDRVESLVSDLENEGKDDRAGPLRSTGVAEVLAFGEDPPEPSFDG